MSERDAAIAATALFVALSMVPHEVGQSIDLRRGRYVLCGDCGPSTSIHDECQFCGGYAEPLVKTNVKGGFMATTTRPAPPTKVKKIRVKK